MDDYFAREMTRQYFEDMNKRNRERAREAQSRRRSVSTSSSDSSPDDAAVLATKKILDNMPNHPHCSSRYVAKATSTNSQFSFTKLLVSCFTGR